MNKSYFLYTLLALLSLALAQKAQAQGCEGKVAAEGDEGKPQIIGYVQPEFNYLLNADDQTKTEDASTFKFRRARIGVTGQIPYDFSYYFMLETSAFVGGTGNPFLLDAYVSYQRFKWFKLSLGSFKQPFGQEVNTSCSGLHTVDRSLHSDQLVSPFRDMGLMVLGGGADTKLNYAVAILNGRGLGVKDNNQMKDFSSRITYRPLEFLRVGGSFRYGFPTNNTEERVSWAAEMELKMSNFTLQGEYMADQGAYNQAAGGGCGSEPMVLGEKRSGAYVLGMYLIESMMLQPVVKYEFLDPGVPSEVVYSTITFGANYWFNDNTRLQLNYRYNAEKNAEVANDAIQVQMQVKF